MEVFSTKEDAAISAGYLLRYYLKSIDYNIPAETELNIQRMLDNVEIKVEDNILDDSVTTPQQIISSILKEASEILSKDTSNFPYGIHLNFHLESTANSISLYLKYTLA